MQPKKNTRANWIMALAIGLIVLIGVGAVGLIRGWFDPRDPAQAAVITEVLGVVDLERDGIVSPVDGELSLRDGDLISTQDGGSVTIQWGDSSLLLDGETQATVTTAGAGDFTLELTTGQVFALTGGNGPVTLDFGGRSCTLSAAAAELTVDSSGETLYLLAGTLTLDGETYGEGQVLAWIQGELSISSFEEADLDDFCLAAALAAWDSYPLCCSKEALEQALADREAQRQAALQAQLTQDETDSQAQAEESESEPTEEESAAADKTAEPDTDTSSGTSDAGTGGNSSDTPGTQADNSQTSSSVSEPAAQPEPEPEAKSTCTISIRCDTILSNLDALDPAKAAYVPSSGVILSTTTVEFSPGDSVYDVLRQVCSAAGIQLEASYTPGYGSYYVEGINNIYEFDCGPESGWMYQVNGQFPSYGCSSYTVSQGDSIVFCYTCTGLGADLG